MAQAKEVKIPKTKNIDEKLTEKQAVAQAKKDGIEFVDEFRIAKKGSGVGATTLPQVYKTSAAAETARKKRKDADKYHVVQSRRQKQPSEA